MDTVKLRVGVVQSRATPNLDANLAELAGFIREAAAKGAKFISLPEACEFLHPDNAEFRRHAVPMAQSKAAGVLAGIARETATWLLVGSLSLRSDAGPLSNRSILFTPEGAIRATYDKIHLFDAHVEDRESLESRIYQRGETAVVVDIGAAKVGLSICYDLRFPHLYRALAAAGAQLLMVPSAFMKVTGEAHWHTLLRARAIENGCFVLAAAQCGCPHEGRESFGHSLIVNPWGEVVADAGLEPGVLVADLDLGDVDRARKRIPSLSHNFDFRVVTA